MGFWGIEVKPGKPHPYHSDNVRGRLHITQATLGLGSSSKRSILQCSVGHKSPILLCSLIPNKTECCALNLEFEENDDLLAFSVIGPRSIHLSGYFVAEDDGDNLRDEYGSDSYEEDIAETESGESSEYGSEDDYEDDSEDVFLDDDVYGEDVDLFSSSPVRKSGVVIEEIMDEEKPTDGNDESKQTKKRKQSSDSEERRNSDCQLTVRNGSGASVLESEDEDGFPASRKSKGTINESQSEEDGQKADVTSEEYQKTKTKDDSDKKRKIKPADEDSQLEREKKKKKKKKKQKEQGLADNVNEMSENEIHLEEVTIREADKVLPGGNKDDQEQSKKEALETEANIIRNENQSEKKKKKKKKKNQEGEGVRNGNEAISSNGNESNSMLKSEEKQATAKSSQVRTFANGLVIEELVMGKPDGKRASRGKQVSVHYICKLKKNGKIFDSNVGRAPFKFRLGIGQVIKGWDVGVEGMRIGDKRRLTIPPSMGYGAKKAGDIPPNSWLEFDVELLDVR